MKQTNILKSVDTLFLVATGILALIGLIILQSASGPSSYNFFGNSYYEVINQLQKGFIPGIILFFILTNFSINWLRKLSILGWILSIGLNILVLIPGIGIEVNGANRWLSIAGIRIQPAEFLKLALIVCLATILFKLGKNINKAKSVLLIFFIIGLSGFIVIYIQSSLSNGLLLVIIALSMLFQSKIKFRFILLFIIIGIIATIIAIRSNPYREVRLNTLLNPEQANSIDKNAKDRYYHSNNNMIAVGSGGILGVGFGESRQKFFYLPEASTDSIFAVFAEENGFVGVILLLSLFLTIIFRILFLYTHTKDDFSAYILIGGVTWFTAQIIINIAPIIKLAPVTGVPLPFISEGGTSMIVFFALFGIIANISKYRNN
jgi:cell division protein FtsW